MLRIGVIGGGAAGFFSAIHAAQAGHEVTIFEKTGKVLSKVKVSGGGRCNVTHHCLDNGKLIKFYPRGGAFLKQLFNRFSVSNTIHWFESRGVKLKVEEDGRMFPVSNSSQSIIDVLRKEAETLGVKLVTGFGISEINRTTDGRFRLISEKGAVEVDRVIISSGGSSKSTGYNFIQQLGHTIVTPIPSLFTFNTPGDSILALQGVAIPDALVRLEGTKLSYSGPLLITHWGLSGPAVLKLSAYGAKWLHDHNYDAWAHIRWQASFDEQMLRDSLREYREAHPKKRVKGAALFGLPARLWALLCERADIGPEVVWCQISKKQNNKLFENLFNFTIQLFGKTTFKEEFVTAGGVPLEEISPKTMESKLVKGVFFAGEVTDIDGITGGFNFQAAWTTGFVAGTSIY